MRCPECGHAFDETERGNFRHYGEKVTDPLAWKGRERRSETPGAADPGRPADTMVRDILDPFRRLV